MSETGIRPDDPTRRPGEPAGNVAVTPNPSALEKIAEGRTVPSAPPHIPPDIRPEQTLTAAQWGMIAFILSEVALFGTLITVYIAFIGNRTLGGPTPKEVLFSSLGSTLLVLASTIILLSSSATIHMAEKALHAANGQNQFRLWWGLTILLGAGFLVGTGIEWYEMIHHHGLTISRNLFGTTYYTLVGFHAMHVTGGVITMTVVLGLALGGRITGTSRPGVELISWYWHFVDVVWVVVFTVVYLIGRWG
jgi:cytochrome c oxidase subunit 3/cytochrome o ubiquinol oxidase subunit 3